MNLDDIIEYFEKTGALGPKGCGLAELQLRTAKLLKAGQAMHRELAAIHNNGSPGNRSTSKAIEVWDAATREGDV